MIRRNTLSLAMMLTLLLSASGSVWGADLYWSGTGTWDNGTSTNWGVTPGGPYNVSAWVSGANAIFEGTAGTVTISGTIASVGSITFTTDGYTLQTGVLTLTGADGNITTGAGTNTINAVIGGTVVTKFRTPDIHPLQNVRFLPFKSLSGHYRTGVIGNQEK